MVRDHIKDALFGMAIGDALGVPVEFINRKTLAMNPVTDMRAYGTHYQPAGTWSDDSSMAFCLADMLSKNYNIDALGKHFVKWLKYGSWTPYGEVFDAGLTCSAAIRRIMRGTPAELAGGDKETDNGNGSLMRIIPLLFYIKDKPIDERFRITREVSSVTHRHIRSVIACFIYLELALELLEGKDKNTAYTNMQQRVNQFLRETVTCTEDERNKFHRILENPIGDYEIVPLRDCAEDEIYSNGYVMNTLEASLWCILHTDNFSDAVLKAVNLGSDADTTGAVTGGLAGLLYGYDAIPTEWLEVLARKDDITNLYTRLTTKLTTP